MVMRRSTLIMWIAMVVLIAIVLSPSGTSITRAVRPSAVPTGSGTVIAWGNNTSGQTAVPVGLNDVVAVAAGDQHAVALKVDGTVVTWGSNGAEQLAVPPGLANVVAIAAGNIHSVALKADGTVVAWGAFQSRFAGGNLAQLAVPAGLNNVSAIAAGPGSDHTLALTTNGTVVAWGRNDSGQTNVPAGLNNVVAIAAGTAHSAVVQADGTVIAWGASSQGQTTVPIGLANVVDVAAGTFHTLALKADGSVVAWGNNCCGQTTIPAGLNTVIAIAAGDQHAVALKADGTVVAWGLNNSGQTTIPAGLSNVRAIAAGVWYTMAVQGQPTNTPPRITVNDVTLEGNTTGGRTLVFADIGSASDAQDGMPNVTCNPSTDLILPLDTTSVICTATDSGGLAAQDAGSVTVKDTTKPMLSLPANQTYEGNTAGGYNGVYTGATASDIVDINPVVNCSPTAGSLFALGTTSVACTATDASGNSSSDSFNVMAVDTTAPTISCPATINGSIGQVGALGAPTVADIVDTSPTVRNDAPAAFPAGTTTIIWKSTDASGNMASCMQQVILTYGFGGLTQPIDTTMPNTAKAGKIIPIRWRLTDANGVPISDPASFVSVTSSATPGSCGGTADAIEIYVGGSGLQYLGDGTWQFNWKTPTSYAGQCRTMSLHLNDGATGRTAVFAFN
jgi:hypothetical protein